MNKTKNTKRIRRIVGGVCAALIVLVSALLLYVGNFLVTYAIGRSGDGAKREVALEVNQEALAKTASSREDNDAKQRERTRTFMEAYPEEEIHVVSADGLQLSGAYYANEGHNWVIAVHGYRSNHYGMLNTAERYHSEGYQVVSPDLRGCGNSEGEYIGMGWPDRKDLLVWIDWITSQDADAHIILHGISMGGATVMMTAGEKLPEQVKAIVEDCGYTSVWDIFSSELQLRFHLPEFPILYVASWIARYRAGYDFTNASSVEQLKKCEVPMLFIHGDQDDFVPFAMMDTVYNAKPGNDKQYLIAEGAGHGRAAGVLVEEYWDTVFAFLDPYLSEN